MSLTPRVRQWEDNAGRKRFTLIRGSHRVHRADGFSWNRETTADFSPEEWAIIERTVLSTFGLMTERQSRENVGRAHEETERAISRIAHLERELDYAATGEEPEEPEVADPPPLLAHGTEWVTADENDDPLQDAGDR